MFPGHCTAREKKGYKGRGIFQHEKKKSLKSNSFQPWGRTGKNKQTKKKTDSERTFSLLVWNLGEQRVIDTFREVWRLSIPENIRGIETHFSM